MNKVIIQPDEFLPAIFFVLWLRGCTISAGAYPQLPGKVQRKNETHDSRGKREI